MAVLGLLLAASCMDSPSAPPLAHSSSAITSVPSPTIKNFVVYAANNLTLGANDKSQGGNLGVATSNGASPQLAIGSQVQVDTQHTLYAPSVSVASQAVVGAVDANTVTNNGGQVGTQASYPTLMPPLPSVFAATPGAMNITVAQGQNQTLTPGAYGALTDNGIVLLNPGTYSFASVTLGNNAQLQAQQGGATSVLIAGGLATGTQAQILPVGQAANELTISVSGTDGTSGSPPAVSMGPNSQLTSLLAAPNGTVSFGNNVQATGAFAGLNFTAGTNVILNFQSGFANALPGLSTFVAYAELGLTLGSGDHTLGGDVGVGATSASTGGAQLVVGSQDQLDLQHTLYAPSVSLASGAIVGDVDTNALTNSGGQFASEAPFPSAAMPLLPLALVGASGTKNVTVNQGTQQTLSPGSYGALVDDGVLLLEPGTYSFASVTLGNNAQLQALQGGSTTIGVVGTLATGTGAQILPVGQQAGSLTIAVAGSDGTNGSPPAASLGANTQIVALLEVPGGTLSLGNNVQGTGAFVGFNLSAGTNVTLTFQTGFPPSSQQPSGQQQFGGYVTGSTTGAPLVGPVPGSTVLSISLALSVQVPQTGPYAGMTLSQVAQAVSDPTNAMYRQYITDTNYAQYYTPTANAYTALTGFLTSQGLTIVNNYADHELVDVSGTAEQFEQMLFVNLNYYLRPDGTQFYAPDRQPSLTLSQPVLQVAGIDDYVLGTPSAGCSTTPNNKIGNGPQGSLMGPDFRTAYISSCASPQLTGAGQSIGLIEGEGFDMNDFETYEQDYNTIAAAGSNPTFPAQIPFLYNFDPIFGLKAIDTGPGIEQTFSGVGTSEAPLDLELAWAMAPMANIVIYYAPELNSATDAKILHLMANPDSNYPRVQTLSSSWLLSYDKSIQQSLDSMAAHGQSFFQGSGDGGALIYNGYQQLVGVALDDNVYTSAPPDVRVANNITLVGGTDILAFSGGSAPTEQVWNVPNQAGNIGFGEPGGGYWGPMPALPPLTPSPRYPAIPGFGIMQYQASAAQSYLSTTTFGSTSYRNFPDVSAVAQNIAIIETIGPNAPLPLAPGSCYLNGQADCNLGSSCCCAGNATACAGVPRIVAGTSASTPLWAGFNALVKQASASAGVAPIGFLNPTLYAIASTSSALYNASFNDIQTGCNPPLVGPDISGGGYQGGPGNASQVALAELVGLPSGGFPAAVGYDMASGLGSFTCGLVNQLSSLDPTIPYVPPFPPSSSSQLSFAGIAEYDTCGILQGQAQCWGNNAQGEEANGTTTPQLSPGCIEGLPLPDTVTQIVAGLEHECALIEGNVWCWGDNTYGELGNDTTMAVPPNAPVEVQGLPSNNFDSTVTVTQIAAGGYASCAVISDGSLWCWGQEIGMSRPAGQTGGPWVTSSLPTQVALSQPVQQVTIGSSGSSATVMCAVTPMAASGTAASSNQVYCWGDNYYGEVGNGSNVTASTPQLIDVGLPTVSISAGAYTVCAIGSTGGLECWGDNSDGQYGNGMLLSTAGVSTGTTPSQGGAAEALGNLTQVASGDGFTCVLVGVSPGSVACFGANFQGQLGTGAPTGSVNNPDATYPPTFIPQFMNNVNSIAAANEGACAQIYNTGALWCWGQAPIGESMSNASSPVLISFMQNCPQ